VTRVMISAQMAGAGCGVDIAGIRSRDFIRIRLAVGLGGSLAMWARSRLVVGIPIGTLKMRETYRSFGGWAALASSLARSPGSKRGKLGSIVGRWCRLRSLWVGVAIGFGLGNKSLCRGQDSVCLGLGELYSFFIIAELAQIVGIT
jgi:hypothetical protein